MNESLSPAELQALKKEILSSLHCALPGIVESFDAESGTASIRLALSGMPVLREVPVFVCNEVNPGDACLVVFADCDADAWFDGNDSADPASGRMHSLSDAFAFVGFKRNSEFRIQNERGNMALWFYVLWMKTAISCR